MTKNDGCEIYIGDLVKYESDRVALETVLHTIETNQISAIVIANINISGRQIDLVVATSSFVLVVEAKKSNRPIRGGENGVWEFQSATKEWKSAGRNYYIQTLEAKNSLHRAMSQFSGKAESYPDAVLVFVDGVPAGSEISGDFKVNIGGIDLLEDIKSKTQNAWTLDQWRSFAREHSFIKLNSPEAAFDEGLSRAAFLLNQYRESFSEYYQSQIDEFVSALYHFGDDPICFQEVLEKLAIRGGLAIAGPSGCGKTMLAQHVAIACAQNGSIPFFIEAKNFEKDFANLLKQESALLVPSSSINELLLSCQILEAQLVIFLDGYNECHPSLRQRLIRCLRAIAIRYQANVVITDQNSSELQQLRLDAIRVSEPTPKQKKLIADNAAGKSISPKVEELLTLARSGLEAKIIGEISKEIEPGISRYALFDSYIRRRIGEATAEAIRTLTYMAGYFSDNLSFSMTVREFDRLREQYSCEASISNKLIAENILRLYGDRLSFWHELYLNAFSAESIVRSCQGDPRKISAAISAPRTSKYRALVLGAIDNINILDAVLHSIVDVELIAACAMGECGEYARVWVNNRCSEILKKVEQEVKSICFLIDDGGWQNISSDSNFLLSWDEQDKYFINSISHLLNKGKYLDEVFHIAGIMDSRLRDAFPVLVEEARQKKIPLRSSLFGAGFVDQHSKIALTRIVASMRLYFSSDRERYIPGIKQWVESTINDTDMSDGQVYFILHICRFLYEDNPLANVLPTLINERWKYAPYHLRIDLLDTARSLWRCSEAERERLIEAINAIKTDNIWISSSIVDALKSLGAIEDDGYEETVKAELEEVFSDPENPENWAMARNLYDRQIDHPYDHIYCRIIQALSATKQKEWLSMAVRVKDNFRMFASSMVTELAAFGDPETGKFIEHWTDLPPEDSPVPQEAVGVFVCAHVVLGHLRYPLPKKKYEGSDVNNAMSACGEIYYWVSRDDMSWDERVMQCRPAWKVLLMHELGVGLSALQECESELHHRLDYYLKNRQSESISLVTSFPKNMSEICRKALSGEVTQRSRRRWRTEEELLGFAVNTLGYCGEATDLILLRSIVDHKYLGSIALDAIKKLEENLARIAR